MQNHAECTYYENIQKCFIQSVFYDTWQVT